MATVLITGAGSGLGLEGALAFARNGDTVYAGVRDPARAEGLTQAAQAEGLTLNLVTLDVTRAETFTAVLADIIDQSGRLDVLVNNAGIIRPGSLEDVSEQDLRDVIETNLTGPLLLARAVLPQMRAQGSGCIIMMSSLSGIAGLPGDLPYSASKFGLEGATEALRHEVDRWGIRVALVEGGMYATGIFDDSLNNDRLLPPDYPPDSPYRPLVESRLEAVRDSLSKAYPARRIGELYVKIAHSDESRLRWPADEVAEMVLGKMFAQDDAGRDAFLRGVAGADWWSEGKDHD
ncbi:SDR family oxidoreductase [Elongatibacter sediminis]|uniref:SDR family oxidoreductase n=1 Tax=Elongatibacter sediminis TaxID=3119006 RepID=A0AAW9R4U3_9GAMM